MTNIWDDIVDVEPEPFEEPVSKIDRAQALQNGLLNRATGGLFDGGDNFYKKIRRELLAGHGTKSLVPSVVRQNRDLSQFWQSIKHKYGSYAERREFLYTEFNSLLDYLETSENNPNEDGSTELFSKFTTGNVPDIWHKALERKNTDPAGAITLARTLIESVCKYILDDKGITYKANVDLPKLWALCAKELNLSPSQHNEETFKSILGNCQSIVNYLGTLRNRLSDSHGQGKMPIKPKPRHAELAVNLAGTMASFLISTWQEQNQS